MDCIEASGIRRIWQMAATMQDPVNFSIGEPDFDAPEPVKAAAIQAIQEGRNKYTLTAGLPELREALAKQIEAEFGWSNPAILVTCGLSGALQLSIMASVNAGEGVLIPDPYFVIYRHIVNLMGARCEFIDTYPDFELTPERLEKSIRKKSKVLFVNSPSNPTGIVYEEQHLRQVAEVAKQHDLLVLSDEIYREFSYEEPATSIGRFYENTIVMRGFSKSYGVPGWRLGYIAAPESLTELVDAMATLQQYTFVCAPQPFQVAALEAIKSDISGHINDYKRKRDIFYEGIKDRFELVKPGGAFYAFVKAPGGKATAFVEQAIQNDVLIIPGAIFSERDTHFRASYATSDDQIKKGVERLCSIVK
jgi:aspartate aminotransferase